MDRWMDHGRMDGCMDGQTGGWMDRWMDGQTSRWMVGWMDVPIINN